MSFNFKLSTMFTFSVSKYSILLWCIGFFSLFLPATTYAQTSIEFIGAASGPATSGPTTDNQVITFHTNATTPYSPPITATFSYSNQQFSTTEGNPTIPGATFGTTSIFGKNTSTADNLALGNASYDLMNAISAPSNANFTACNACGVGTGIDITANRAVALFSAADALINSSGVSTYALNARVQFADLTITFSQPVNNPMLHVVGLGGGFYTIIPLFQVLLPIMILDLRPN
jgi:hypothetical protein